MPLPFCNEAPRATQHGSTAGNQRRYRNLNYLRHHIVEFNASATADSKVPLGAHRLNGAYADFQRDILHNKAAPQHLEPDELTPAVPSSIMMSHK